MDTDYALNWLDSLVLDKTGHRLNDLQRLILQQVWQGRKYFDIAVDYGCTEGHAKDVGSQLWKSLSEILGEKITKQNCRSVTERCLRKARTLKRKIGNKIEQWGLSTPLNPLRNADLRFCEDISELNKPTDSWFLEDLRPLDSTPDLQRFENIGGSTFHGPLSGTERDASDAYSFVGRADAIAHLAHFWQLGHRLVVIQGEGGLGKTTLAQQFFASQNIELVLELFIAKEPQNITPAEYVVEEWLKQDLGDEAGTDFGISLSRLKRHLRSRSIGIVIDNLESALDRSGCFIRDHRDYGELLRVLGDSNIRSFSLITSRDRLCESGVNLVHYRLPSLDSAAWTTFFRYRNLPICPDTVHAMHRAYGGNAKAMGLLCGVIQEDFGGDMRAYWHLNQEDLLVTPDLRNLVCSQVDRLQTLDPDAYRLFCRMGCYRYQTVPRVPSDGILALLWDVSPGQQHRVMTALKNRSLLECQDGAYSLHPAVQADAIARLRATPDWDHANREAATFWTTRISRIETRQDALHALEAYYHYIAIDDLVAASQVILKSRINQWNQFLSLGSTLYRFGLVYLVFEAVAHVTEQLKSQHPHSPQLGELYNIWGDLHWIMGRVHAAIACQQQTIEIATQQIQSVDGYQSDIQNPTHGHHLYYLKMLAIDSSLSIGLYNIDLWELEVAAAHFEQVIAQAQHTRHHSWADKAMVCLSLVKAHQAKRASAIDLADRVYDCLLNSPDDSVGRVAYFLQILGHAYGHLGHIEKATILLARASAAAEAGQYLQIQGRTINALGAIARQQQQYEQALAHHTTAMQLLENIGAVCDLAEAHVQLGITHQQMNQIANSQRHFERAIALFQSMSAPKQVQKVMALRDA